MWDSDNFVAEQLLLNCSMASLGYISDSDFLFSFKKKYLFNLSQEPKWYDGSGLSRYNALTPAALADVLERILQLKGAEYISNIFPAGGASGTLKDYLRGPEGKPFVFAKSGSLKGIYNLSGYMITKSGRLLIFSWLNNNVNRSTSDIKVAIEQYLLFVYNHY